MDALTTYFLGNRIWSSVALLAGPIAGAVAGNALVAVVVIGLFVLAVALTRPWA